MPRSFFVLGMTDRLAELVDPSRDALGQLLEEEYLPKRIHAHRPEQWTGNCAKREIYVYIDIGRKAVLVGRLWTRERGGHATLSFTYDDGWPTRRGAFALSPSLMLSPRSVPLETGAFWRFHRSRT